MDNDTRQCIIVCTCITVAFLSFMHGCTAVMKAEFENQPKTICLQQAKQWQDGNCVR